MLLTVVLICHQDDPIDSEAIAAWLACDFSLVGIVLLRDAPGSRVRKLRRECRRVGWIRLLDVILFRVFYQLSRARKDARWVQSQAQALRARYGADLGQVPRHLAHNPNEAGVREFIAGLQPDFAIARCKYILQPAIFTIPRYGTYALHPGICPLYRNAHGCFWALVSRDLANVGMTLLRVDAGIDTGPMYLQASCAFDELRESHVVIQHRVVLENLAAISQTLRAISDDTARPLDVSGKRSVNRGQPWLTAYLRWKWLARGARA
jgi:folate-dependent phosphoribosylglycinamide formyltransferase PurN